MILTAHKRRLLLEFYKSTILINLVVSALGFTKGLGLFLLLFCSIGLAGCYIYKNTFHKNEYYFYYNAGLYKRQLFGVCLAINVLISSLILLCT